MDERLSGIAGRLQDAFQDWQRRTGGDKKSFAAEMKRRFKGRGGQKGTSYQTVLSYFDGRFVPSLEWLSEAAELLGVRLDWLALGGQPQTPEQQQEYAEFFRRVESTIYGVMEEAGVSLSDLPATATNLLSLALDYTARRLRLLNPAIDDTDGLAAWREAAGDVGRALVAPVMHLQLHTDEWSRTEKSNYVIHMTAALIPLIEAELERDSRRLNEERPTPREEMTGRPL
jgi:hypothetical protein